MAKSRGPVGAFVRMYWVLLKSHRLQDQQNSDSLG
jgi:hypothetical protein